MATSSRAPKNADVTSTDLEKDIGQLRADMAQLVEHLKKMGEQSGSAARKAANEGVEQLRVQGEAAMRSVRDGAEDLEHQLASTVRERPITSLALALGAGFLIALATRR
ncbi:DUF883 family protein [Nitratireductor indicus]|uniref:DUF883 domain-containing protein n=1 Tax=Nitratireductor indicus C115 TaxID=1231190 RepID=K2N3K2_9HYPH|nr:DUF883 family protein [Nitratireductor indicus]EKF41973.1 hypothetical protein NA8A_12910 [Nitratireductor indicus C115]MDS1136618.1 DUF883 family protein [Nitratireductor indicus]SFQ47582.1 Membrane-anchored ribosome-binding protein, inhibits growth in stationary phase, ElaB/YqjD/DUF883 family [Nitratireductor indicus]